MSPSPTTVSPSPTNVLTEDRSTGNGLDNSSDLAATKSGDPKLRSEVGTQLGVLDPAQSIEESRHLRLAAMSQLKCRSSPVWKRTFDVIASLCLIAALCPLILMIAIYIWLMDGGPVLFKQKRLGFMGRDFVIYKFRTLKTCPSATSEHRKFVAGLSSSEEAACKPDLSERAIPGGNFLRRTSLDELPQLFNILRGEMSLIGPRPDVLEWSDYRQWQLRRFEVVPGVTGLWQVSGKNRLTFNEMIEKDIEYVENRSLRMDLMIALMTFRLLLTRDNS